MSKRVFHVGPEIRSAFDLITDRDMRKTTGETFWLMNDTEAFWPTFQDQPKDGNVFNTMESALNSCVAERGDTIYVAPSYTENISAASSASGWDLDKADISIIGLGTGANKPTITFDTAATADLDIDAANISIKNIRFVSGVAALAAMIDVNAAEAEIDNCEFMFSAAANHILLTILTDATANGIKITNNKFFLEYSNEATPIIAGTASTSGIRLVGADRAVVSNNSIYGNFTASAVEALTTACRDVNISHNAIRNVQTTDIAGAIDLVANTTGVVAYNHGFHGHTTDIANVIDPASCAMIENYFSNVVTEAGGLVGTAST